MATMYIPSWLYFSSFVFFYVWKDLLLRLYEKRAMRRTVGPNMVGGAGDWRKMYNEELSHTILFSSTSQGILGWAGHVTTRSQCLSALRARRTRYPASIPDTTDIFLLPTASTPVRIIQTLFSRGITGSFT